jgi:class 3 adenylate cyclase
LHHCPAVERDGDLFGAAVNLTARVAAQAFGGQVLATEEVAEAARAADIATVALGSFSLRNLLQPVELWEIHLCPLPSGGAVDPVCRMRIDRAQAAGRLRHSGTDCWFCSLECVAAFATDPTHFTEVSR